MSVLINNSTSLLLSSDEMIRKRIMQPYMTKINNIILFPQLFVASTGLLGNTLALIIINRKPLKNTSSAVFITYMAVFDSSVLLLHASNLLRLYRNLYLRCLSTYLIDVFTFCANWVLVIITLERFLAVCFPLLAKRFCTVYSARLSIYILITMAITIFTSTFPIFYHPNKRKCIIHPRFESFLHIYKPIIMIGLPDIFLLSNFFTINALIRREEKQKRQSIDSEQIEMRIADIHSSRKQRQLTIMLITVNLAFYLFTTPAVIIFITEMFPRENYPIYRLKRIHIVSQIAVILLQLHHATNFIFYCLAGQRFRRATIETFYEYSNRLKVFYHRFILCNKHYRLPVNLAFGSPRTTLINSRIRTSESIGRPRLRTSTL